MKQILKVKEMNAWNARPFEERKRLLDEAVVARNQANALLTQAAALAKSLPAGSDPSSDSAIRILQDRARQLLVPHANTPMHFDPKSYEARLARSQR